MYACVSLINQAPGKQQVSGNDVLVSARPRVRDALAEVQVQGLSFNLFRSSFPQCFPRFSAWMQSTDPDPCWRVVQRLSQRFLVLVRRCRCCRV